MAKGTPPKVDSKPSDSNSPPASGQVVSIVDKMLTEAFNEDPSAQNWAKKGMLLERMVRLIEASHVLALDEGRDLYEFSDGAYRRLRDKWTGDLVRAYLDRPALGIRLLSTWLIHEVEAILKMGKKQLWPIPKEGMINVLNGILDTNRIVLLPHTKDWLSPVQLPIKYDPKATCPAIDKFISEVFPPDCIDLAWEVIGSCLVSDRVTQSAIWLEGAGGNGKSTFIFMVQGLVGQENTANIPVKDLHTNRFTGSDVHGKLLMFDLDASIEVLEDPTLLKKIISGDEVAAEKKHKDRFTFRPHCKVILSGNRPPTSRDYSHGWFRRLIIVPFSGLFDQDDKRVNQDALLAKLLTDSERSGALNKAILGLNRLKSRGRYDSPESAEDATAEFRRQADHFQQFFEARVMEEDGARLSAEDLAEQYERWAVENRKRRVDSMSIGQWIGRKFKGKIKSEQVRLASAGLEPDGRGRRVRIYLGLRWRDL